MMEIIVIATPYIITAIGGIIVAVIETRNAKVRKRTEARAERREQEERLSIELMGATCSLAQVTAKKVTGMHTNGDVEEAMKAADEAHAKYKAFIADMAAHQVVKI